MAVTEPVPVTLPATLLAARERGVVEGRVGGVGGGGRETGTLDSMVSGLISIVCGSGVGACSGSSGWGVCPEFRVGTGATLSLSTSRDDTLVTVPDCTVSPGEGRELALEAAARDGDGNTGVAAEAGGTTTPPELVLGRGRARESSEQMPGLHKYSN